VIMKSVASAYIERWNFALGAIFVVIVLFMPEGLVPGTTRLFRLGWARLKKKSAVPAETGR
jgi:branched-chain amino acid transport system permease protein